MSICHRIRLSRVAQPSRLCLFLTALLLLPVPGFGAELPAGFPEDVPLADYMIVVGVTQVRDDMMISLHAPGRTVAEVSDWFENELTAAGWQLSGASKLPRGAILPFSKGTRRCGITITDFVLNSSAEMDHDIKSISLQISGSPGASEGGSAASAAGAAEVSR